MADKGFAIRCPHCRTWNVWKDKHPKEIALVSEEELKKILDDLNRAIKRGEQDRFSHSKLWRCQSPRWLCPASFEAFVCLSEKDAFKFLKIVESWSFKRDFRLYKADCQSRWEDKYYGILFCTQPIPRQQDVELEILMDRELLSRLIVGMSVEIETPLTVYAANIFHPIEKDSEIFWMPIEAYSQGKLLVPARFNKLCHTTRELVMRQLVDKFESENYSVNKCPIEFGKDGKCARRNAACIQSPKDWNHCPAFIKKREEKCPCYKSDREAIKKVEKKWRDKGSMENGVRHRCYAGFNEVAFPIVVHDHLVGVAMTGQVFCDPKQITAINDFINAKCEWDLPETHWDLLYGKEDTLEEAKGELISEEKELKKENKSRFFITKNKFDKRISLLHSNIQRITKVANSRYCDFRGKSESAFRQEMLGRIQNCKMETDFFKTHVLDVLERMREFWAFEGSYLIGYSYTTKDISVIAYKSKRNKKAFGIPGKKQANVTIEHQQMHPCPFVYQIGQEPPRDTRLEHFFSIIKKVIHDSGLKIHKDEYEFGVLIPFYDQVYTFIFAVRDQENVCRLERQLPGGISKLCQDAMLETCTQVIYEFGDVKSFVELRERAHQAEKVIEIITIAGQFAHRLSNTAGTIPVVINDLKERCTAEGISEPDIFKRLDDLKVDVQELMEMADQLAPDKDHGELVPLKASEVVEKAIRAARVKMIKSDINLTRDISPDLPLVMAVETFLVETLVNLLRNAAEANAKNIHVTAFDRSNVIDLVVTDDGNGMSKPELEKIFLPFYFNKKSKKRSGLHGVGLWTSRLLIVNTMGGNITVESELGKGSRFVVTLNANGGEH